MNSKESEVRTQLLAKLSEMKKRVSKNTFEIPTLGKKFSEIHIPVPVKGEYQVSKIGLKFGDLIYIVMKRDGRKVYENFAIYVGTGKDDANKNNKEEEHWFLGEKEDGIHYYGNLLTKADLARLGIRKVA